MAITYLNARAYAFMSHSLILITLKLTAAKKKLGMTVIFSISLSPLV
jgi:hypothetical protein